MIATKDTLEPKSSDYVMPNSQRVYVEGEIHPEVRVPFREIAWRRRKISTASSSLTSRPRLRLQRPVGRPGICRRLEPRPSGRCAPNGSAGEGTSPNTKAAKSSRKTTAISRAATKNSPARPSARTASTISRARKRKPLRASAGHPVTQLWYARRASSPPRWSSLRSAKTSAAQQKAEGRRNERRLRTS